MESLTNQEVDSFDVLFELFDNDEITNDIMCNEILIDDIDNGDETSSESSGSSGHSSSTSTSPPFQQLTTYYPTPPKVEFGVNQLSRIDDNDVNETSNKRSKTEEKLIRNRLSANKSRLKRKNERLELEETVANLRERVRVLEMENNALLTDNTTLTQHNFFLQELLKKHQLDSDANREAQAPPKSVTSRNHMSAISGISVLCVVFSVSFFSDWLPASLMGSDGEDSWNVASSSGRVLLSVDDDDYSTTGSFVSLASAPSQSSITMQYILILTSMFLYYFYIQYESAMQKKSSNILPS
jgi:hypothetical protein